MSSSNSPCAACKFLRRKCTQECVFAPYFPPDNPQRFAYVHKVFGASNVAKLLNELSAAQRDDAVKSLAYEAEARLRDPVYGCVGIISLLQQRLRQIQGELNNAKKELATYIGPQAHQPISTILPPSAVITQHHAAANPFSSAVYPYNSSMAPPGTGAGRGGQLVIRDANQAPPQILEGQQLAAAREQQEMFRSYEEHQDQFLRFSGGFEVGSVCSGGGFNNHLSEPDASAQLALGSFENPYQVQQPPQQGEGHHHLQVLLPPQQSQPHQQQSETEEGRSVGLSC